MLLRLIVTAKTNKTSRRIIVKEKNTQWRQGLIGNKQNVVNYHKGREIKIFHRNITGLKIQEQQDHMEVEEFSKL